MVAVPERVDAADGSPAGRLEPLSRRAPRSPIRPVTPVPEHAVYRPIVTFVLTLAAAPAAQAQLVDDTFEVGSNLDDWVAWDAQYSSIATVGGNPLEHLTLDNVGGDPACQSVVIAPSGVGPFSHAGDWTAAGIQRVSVDVNVRQGRYGGEFCLVLVSDPGTPSNSADDCTLTYVHEEPSPGGIGWRRYAFSVPSGDPIAPPGWVTGGACAGSSADAVWASVMADVDRVEFVLDAIPGASCVNTYWNVGVDNIAIRTGTLGSVYCLSGVNSTGDRAHITGLGSPVASQEDVTFDVSSLPAESFGYFLMSELTSRVPVHEGDLCLGGQIKRFSGDVQRAGQEGIVRFSPDVTSLPMGAVFQPGDTWNFQYWYRDIGPSSNFSEALSVEFE